MTKSKMIWAAAAMTIVLSLTHLGRAQQQVVTETVTYYIQNQHDSIKPGTSSALAVRFEPEQNWYFYASPEDAPGGMNLKVIPEGPEHFEFDQPIFPPSERHFDQALQRPISRFSGDFTVYIPFELADGAEAGEYSIQVAVEGAICRAEQCRVPFFDPAPTVIEVDPQAAMEANFQIDVQAEVAQPAPPDGGQWGSYGWYIALPLALIAGLALNLMPCVWPVLPLIVMKILDQAHDSRGKSFSLGVAFSGGILGFFAILAGANIVLQLVYQRALQWGDQFRSPAFVIGISLLLVVLAMFMFGLINFQLPGSVSSKSPKAKGYAGSVGTGFLAAVLSTPCSFAIMAAAFAWAQAQPLALGTIAIMVIGLGMAIPYLVLTSMPALLKKLPRSGQWMEIFKELIGFVLLGIAVKLIADLPQGRTSPTLIYAVILALATWMWGSWVGFNTPARRKWLIRISALAIAAGGGWALLPGPGEELIDWQSYDSQAIENALEQERPVLLKFTADWCVACMVADARVYRRADIAELIESRNVLAVLADTTTRDMPGTHALNEIYNEPGIPVSILILPDSRDDVRWRGTNFGDELKEYLESLDDYEAGQDSNN